MSVMEEGGEQHGRAGEAREPRGPRVTSSNRWVVGLYDIQQWSTAFAEVASGGVTVPAWRIR